MTRTIRSNAQFFGVAVRGIVMNEATTFQPRIRRELRQRVHDFDVLSDDFGVLHRQDGLIQTLDHFIAGFAEQVAVVDRNWIILSVNDAWKQMIKVAGYPELVPGTDYRDFLTTFASTGHESATKVLSGVRAIDDGETDSFEYNYAGVDEWEGRSLRLCIHRLRIQGYAVATIARQDITDSCELNRLRQDYTAALLRSEGEARSRLTRELHDSTAQLLTSINLSLAGLKEKAKRSKWSHTLDEIQEMVVEATREVRSISYLAHTPQVCVTGIVKAIEDLGAGFGKRARLDVSFRVFGARTRLTPVAETTVYRIAQEALSNVHRHARATNIQMSLVFRRGLLHLIIADNGIGLSEEIFARTGMPGIGLFGMRSRLAEIGGRLSVRRLRPGTAMIASVPADANQVFNTSYPRTVRAQVGPTNEMPKRR